MEELPAGVDEVELEVDDVVQGLRHLLGVEAGPVSEGVCQLVEDEVWGREGGGSLDVLVSELEGCGGALLF